MKFRCSRTKIFSIVTFAIAAWLLGGCAGAVGIRLRDAGEKKSYYSFFNREQNFSVETANLLGDYLLTEKLDKLAPEAFITDIEALYRRDKRRGLLVATVETAFYLAQKHRNEPERCASLLLTALLYSHAVLYKQGVTADYSQDIVLVQNIGNIALMQLFEYLEKKNIWRNGSYSLHSAGGRPVFFQTPHIDLAFPGTQVKRFIPCAKFRVRNLTHSARQFGIGVPMIAQTDERISQNDRTLSVLNTTPATLLFVPDKNFDITAPERLSVRLCFIDPAKYDLVKYEKMVVPLEQDFSTVLAYSAANKAPMRHFLLRTFLPESSAYEGLYLLSPRDDKKIPVLLVHGLMSDIRTWLQMINTLQSDPVLRRHYRFMGFSYSSGNPVLFSGHLLRTALAEERQRMVNSGKSLEKFDRMVVIGHSMGGLLSRLCVSSCGEDNIGNIVGREQFARFKEELSPEEYELVKRSVVFSPVKSIKRVIFVASPHRGSQLAQSWYGRLGGMLIRLPRFMRNYNEKVIAALLGIGAKSYAEELRMFNGINNLAPEGMALKLMNSLAMPEVPYHSIIGNIHDAVPGDSDGVVAYNSSHLDGAASELVVKSGHSVQRNALAIQEIRRILLAHLETSGRGGETYRSRIWPVAAMGDGGEK